MAIALCRYFADTGSADFLDTSWMLNMLVNFSGCRKASWEINALFFLTVTYLCLPQPVTAQVTQDVQQAKPKNVLILYADDWRHDTLSVAGNPVVKTPVLDDLAKRSVRFTHNCVTTSICCVSRASLFTGQWMSAHGCEGFKPFKTDWNKTYPGVLRDAGYHVGHVCLLYTSPSPRDRG